MVMSVILAAGKGTRMVSDLPKVLHPLLGAPLLEYAVEKVEGLGCDPRVVVVGYGREHVERAFEGRDLTWAHQAEQLGTGHAAAVGVEALGAKCADGADDTVLILNGDLPLLRAETLERLLERHRTASADVTILTCEKSDPTGYGRIHRDGPGGRLIDIVEEQDVASTARTSNRSTISLTSWSRRPRTASTSSPRERGTSGRSRR